MNLSVQVIKKLHIVKRKGFQLKKGASQLLTKAFLNLCSNRGSIMNPDEKKL